VSLYTSLSDEIQSEGIAAALAGRGVRVLLPRVVGAELELSEREPAVAQAIRASEVDVFVVPGLLFDRSGRRLGRGGGHFDRLLARARPDALRVGVCPAARLVAELPEDPWDVRMHRVVTELETLRTGEPTRAEDEAT
jgi:5-formyltetrahydrofolate cyclo-ligase